MGLFSKVKEIFTRGGVTITFAAPHELQATDQVISAQVTLLSPDKHQQVNSVSFKLIQVDEHSPAAGERQPSFQERVLAEGYMNQAFFLQPRQPMTVTVDLAVQANAPLPATVKNALSDKLSQAVEVMQKISTATSGVKRSHKLRVSADLEGVTFDPYAEQPIQILNPNYQ